MNQNKTESKWDKIIETMKKEAEFDSHISKTSIGKLEKERDNLIQEAKEEEKEKIINIIESIIEVNGKDISDVKSIIINRIKYN
jgi:hypothetical protein